MNITRSQQLFAEAQSLFPGGVHSPVRAFRAVGGQPLFIARGEGAYLYDVDGNRFVDYVLSWGPLILGHAHPRVVQALADAAARGTSYGAPSPLEVELEYSSEPCLRAVSISRRHSSRQVSCPPHTATRKSPLLSPLLDAHFNHWPGTSPPTVQLTRNRGFGSWLSNCR